MESMHKRSMIINRHSVHCLFVFLMLMGLLVSGCKTKKDQDPDEGTPVIEKAEPHPPVNVISKVDRSTVTFRDIVTYTLIVEAASDINPKIPEMGSKIRGLRIVDMGGEGPKERDGLRVWEKWYRLQPDITGSYIIPPVTVRYQDPNGRQQEATAPQIFIEVQSSIKEGEELGDIRDIKPLEKIRTDYSRLYILVGSMVFLLLLGFGTWFYLRKKGVDMASSPPPPDEMAISALENLKASEYLKQEDFRAFYFRLSEILRAYMEKRFGFPAQESTTEELIPRIEALDLTRAQKDMIRFLSKGEDLVKFARHRPTVEKAREDWEETRRIILTTKSGQETEGGTA